VQPVACLHPSPYLIDSVILNIKEHVWTVQIASYEYEKE
jgi:hypothetical protein